jgi:hypothetical protein
MSYIKDNQGTKEASVQGRSLGKQLAVHASCGRISSQRVRHTVGRIIKTMQLDLGTEQRYTSDEHIEKRIKNVFMRRLIYRAKLYYCHYRDDELLSFIIPSPLHF